MSSSGSGEDCHCCTCCGDVFRSDPLEKQVLEEMGRHAHAKDAGSSAQPRELGGVPTTTVNSQPKAANVMSATTS